MSRSLSNAHRSAVLLASLVVTLSSGSCTYYAAKGPLGTVPGDGGPQQCVPQDVETVLDVPNIYFVLDHSGSMTRNNKWSTTRDVVSDLMNKLGPKARFGAAIFPNAAEDQCAPGVEVLSLRSDDSVGVTAALMLDATSAPPKGGTPTAPTMESLEPILSTFVGPTFAILATDGGANCSEGITCSAEECTANIDETDPRCFPGGPNCCDPRSPGATANCLDTTAAIEAVSRLKAADVKTYVIGMEGSEPYERQLDQLAVAGDTARATQPRYYRVDSADAQALTEALTRVVNDILASCTVTLAGPHYDPANVVVLEQDVTVPQDPQDGWTLAGDRLTFHGASCQKLLANDRAGLTIHAGCTP